MSKLKTIIRLLKKPTKMVLPMGQNGCFSWIPDEIYLKILYRCEVGTKLNLKNPKTFSEKLQWLKLNDRNPEYCTLVDKYIMKSIVKDKIGEEYVIPLLGVWDKAEDIDFDSLPDQFVLKCNHDSGGVVICKDKRTLDKKVAIKKLITHQNKDAYIPSREWPYKNVHKVIFAEKLLIDNSEEDLIDYKFYCFGGEPKYCQIIKNRTTNETIDFYDIEWNIQPFTGLGQGRPHGTYTPKPPCYEKMIEIARIFAKGTRFVRIDLFNVDGHIYFGEFTLYPKSGLGFFKPEEWNERIGNMLLL